MLPAEVWSLIITKLDKPEAKSFSSTSRHFRALALPKLFSSIRFRFGLPFDTDEYDEMDEERARRTLETLEKIVNPSENELDFAHMIRELQVIIVGSPFFGKDVPRSLPLALKRLKKLQTFFWIGAHLSPLVVNELASLDRCSLFLCAYEIDDVYANVLRLSSNVKSIETINEWAPFTSKHVDSNDVEDVLEEIITRHWESLESLGLDSSCMRALSRGYFDDKLAGITTNLTHLAVENSSECFALRTIFCQAHALESLALIESESIYLPLDENALPNLRDLKVGIQRRLHSSGTYPNMISAARTIHDFILLHKGIRRFDFSQYISWIEEDEPKENLDDNAAWLSNILDAVCTLENVAALGLTFPALTITDMEDALLRVADCGALKKTCKALHLGGITNVPLWDWTFEFPLCTFLALSNRRPEQRTNTYYALTPRSVLLNHKDLHLEQLCLHGSLFDNLSISPDGKVDYEFWSDFRAFRRTEKDFCSLDAYWLMRYRLLSERYDDDESYYSDENEEDTEDEWTTVAEDEEVDDVVEHEEDEAADDDDIGGLIVN
ncbi:hypothetical protein ACEPAG_8866 [Sanghuangporus baumii]